MSLTPEDRELLRTLALESIRHGLREGCPLPVRGGEFPSRLERPGAVFVTLQREGRLRGCIGSYRARRPLVEDVAENAFAAAFKDPRFMPLAPDELPSLVYHLSLLTPPEPMEVSTLAQLLEALRPGVDGLFLEDPPHRATFLPQVWEALPDPDDFVGELLRKAGLPRQHWSDTLRAERYTVLEF